MPEAIFPPLITADALLPALDDATVLVVYTGRIDTYLARHIPGAVRLEPSFLKLGLPPAAGLLPGAASLEWVFRQLGLNQDQHVVCYDDAAGTEAGRLFWVLEAMGHKAVSYLDGGFKAWEAAGLPTTVNARLLNPSGWSAHPDPTVVADKEYVLASLKNPAIQILDSRSKEEYDGLKSASERRGRIPGAIHMDWLDTRDPDQCNRLKSPEILGKMLQDRGFDRRHEIIVHCQTHMRSSHTFMMLRSIGYDRVRGYDGAWSEWAADPAMPVELS